MKKLWKTLLVTLLVVSMLSGMVTAFAAEGDPASGDGETEVAGDNTTPAPDKENEDDPVDPDLISAQGLDALPISNGEAGLEPVSETDPDSEPVSEPEPDSEPAPEPETVDGSCLITAYYDDEDLTFISSYSVLEGSNIVVDVSFILDNRGAFDGEPTGSYTVDGASGDLNFAPVKSDFDESYYQGVPLTVTAPAGGTVTFNVAVTGTSGGKPVTFRNTEFVLNVVSKDSVASDKSALEDAIGKAEAVLGYDSEAHQFTKESDYTSDSITQFMMDGSYYKAQNVLSDPGADQNAVDDEVEALTDALAGLVEYKKPAALEEAKAALQEAVDREAPSGLSEEAQALLESRENLAKYDLLLLRMNEDEEGFEGTVEWIKDTAYRINGIKDKKIPADKTALEEAITKLSEEMANLKREDYTTGSLAKYDKDVGEALRYAYDLKDDPLAHQDDVDDHVKWMSAIKDNDLMEKATVDELRKLLDEWGSKDDSSFTADQQKAYARAKTLVQNFVDAADAGSDSFTDGVSSMPFEVSERMAQSLAQILPLAAQGKMPADRTELKAAVEAAKKALEEKKAFSSDAAYKELEKQITNAEYVIDYENHPDATLRLPEQLSELVKGLKEQTDKVLALKSDSVPKTGDPLVPVVAGGVVLMTLLAAAWVGKKALARK